MNRLRALLAIVLTLGLALAFPRIRCWWRERHNPARHPLGGFVCRDCGEAGADYEAMGFERGGYVGPTRTRFSRERRELTRGGWDEPEGRVH